MPNSHCGSRQSFRSPPETFIRTALLAAAGLIFLVSSDARAQWEQDVRLSSFEGNATLNENMGHCILSDGSVLHVIWAETKNKDSAIYYKRSTDNGATWAPEMRLSPAPSADGFPLLAQSGSTLHLVFRRNGDTPQSESFYKRSIDGGLTWGPDVSLGKTKWWSGVAAVGSNVYVSLNTVFADDDKNSVVFFRRSTDNGATWEPQQQISQSARRTGGRSEDPAIVADGKYVHLVWNDNRDAIPGKGMSVYYRRSSDMGATFSPEVALTHPPDYTYFPTVFAAGPNVDIPYGDRQTGHYHIYYVHSADFGSTWEPKAQITKTADAEMYPAIARDGSNVHMMWTGKEGIMYLHSGNGGASWDAAVNLVSKGSFPFIAVSGDALYMIFVSQRDGHNAIYYKRNAAGNKAAAAR